MFACLGTMYLPWYWFIQYVLGCPKMLGHFFSGRWSYDLLVTSNTITATICAKGAIRSHPRNESWWMLKVPGACQPLKILGFQYQENEVRSRFFSDVFVHGFFPPPLAPDLCVQWTSINLAINQSDIICLNGFQCFLWNHSLTLVGISWVFLCHFSHHQKNPRKVEEKEEEKEDHRISELRIALLSNLALASSRLKQYRPAVGGWTAVDWTDCAKSLGLSPSDILSDLF